MDDLIKTLAEFNIPWVIRGNILTLLGEREFIELEIKMDKELIMLRLELIEQEANKLKDSDPRKSIALKMVKEVREKENIV